MAAGEEFLAGAGFTEEEDGRSCGGCKLYLGEGRASARGSRL